MTPTVKSAKWRRIARDGLEAVFVAIAIWFVIAEFPFATLRFVYELY